MATNSPRVSSLKRVQSKRGFRGSGEEDVFSSMNAQGTRQTNLGATAPATMAFVFNKCLDPTVGSM